VLGCQPLTQLRPEPTGASIAATQEARLSDKMVGSVIRGALLRLDDTQVRDRPGRNSSFFDYCGERPRAGSIEAGSPGMSSPQTSGPRRAPTASGGEPRCRAHVFIKLPLSQRIAGVHPFGLEIRNEIGEWSTYLGIAPSLFGRRRERLFFAVQDSTMFVPAAVGYPMFLLQTSPSDGTVVEMLRLARGNIARYRRGDAYNFWLSRPAQSGVNNNYLVTYPHNIPPQILQRIGHRFLAHPEQFTAITENISRAQVAELSAWTETLFDPTQNPHGIDSAFNIPNDADDTATAVAFEVLYRGRPGLPGARRALIREQALEVLKHHRDLNRSREDGNDAWKGSNSGAFLTWIKDEDEPPFANPAVGVIPRATNNVDCVVNANALLALGLAGRQDMPGFADAVRLSARAIREKAWPECGLYYPQKMVFPYAISRAYRDGRVRDPELSRQLGKLMQDVMAAQAPDGHFDGGLDKSHDLATALAVATLLNLGEEASENAAIATSDYSDAIRAGLGYLHRSARPVAVRNPDTFARWPPAHGAHKEALAWKPGIFFASAFWGLIEWRSEAYTNAIVLEAFLRYALAFDRHGEGIQGRYRLVLDERTFALRASERGRMQRL
jgi:hypothetical protein